MSNAPSVVAIINSNPDVIDMLRAALEAAGLAVVSTCHRDIREGSIDLEAFVGQHNPKVILYDVAIPYDSSWELFQHLQGLEVMQGRFFLLTTPNRRAVDPLAKEKHQVFEVIGKPYDLAQITEATAAALRAVHGEPERSET